MINIVLIALMCGFLLPNVARGYNSGIGVIGGTAWNEYGPQLNTLWIHCYASEQATYIAIVSHSADIMDGILLPTQAISLSSYGAFNTSYIAQLAIDEIDWNTAFLPFNITAYRQALANILNVGKVSFVSTYLGGAAIPAYSPIPGDIVVNSEYPWYNPP